MKFLKCEWADSSFKCDIPIISIYKVIKGFLCVMEFTNKILKSIHPNPNYPKVTFIY